ncbi:hypothetical protein RJ639_030537 [Escallonia herrerae]|uniref:Uncharacterized protein n=1 Tax=Escallonia herrerae TaxID=1293975 RepID=A0AA88X4I1_9ASTE|nr:hypothetical protein RJ639_030537 [Escallonia herrerae]
MLKDPFQMRFCQMSSLGELSLQGNKLSGSIPSCIGKLSNKNAGPKEKIVPKGAPLPIISSASNDIVDGSLVLEIYKRICCLLVKSQRRYLRRRSYQRLYDAMKTRKKLKVARLGSKNHRASKVNCTASKYSPRRSERRLLFPSSNQNVLATPTALATSSRPSFKKKWCDFHKWGSHSTNDYKQNLKDKNSVLGYTPPRSPSQQAADVIDTVAFAVSSSSTSTMELTADELAVLGQASNAGRAIVNITLVV